MVEQQRTVDTVRAPDAVGVAERAGVELAWKVYGTGDRTVLLLPTMMIVDSAFW